MDFWHLPCLTFLSFKNGKLRCLYLKALGIHANFATIKNSYFINDKHLEANTKVIHALKSTLNNDYLCRVANFDSAFVDGTL